MNSGMAWYEQALPVARRSLYRYVGFARYKGARHDYTKADHALAAQNTRKRQPTALTVTSSDWPSLSSARLKDVGSKARQQIEALLGTPVYLDLRVKLAKDWQRDPKQLRRLGF